MNISSFARSFSVASHSKYACVSFPLSRLPSRHHVQAITDDGRGVPINTIRPSKEVGEPGPPPALPRNVSGVEVEAGGRGRSRRRDPEPGRTHTKVQCASLQTKLNSRVVTQQYDTLKIERKTGEHEYLPTERDQVGLDAAHAKRFKAPTAAMVDVHFLPGNGSTRFDTPREFPKYAGMLVPPWQSLPLGSGPCVLATGAGQRITSKLTTARPFDTVSFRTLRHETDRSEKVPEKRHQIVIADLSWSRQSEYSTVGNRRPAGAACESVDEVQGKALAYHRCRTFRRRRRAAEAWPLPQRIRR